MVFQLIYQRFGTAEKSFPMTGLVMPGAVVQVLDACRRKGCIPEETVIGIVHHILPDEHAQFVTLVVEFFHLCLNVFPEGVEAQGFHGKNIIRIAFRCRWGQQTLRPITLI